MNNNENPLLNHLFDFLKKAKILSHKVINTPENISGKSQFLSINDTISEDLIQDLIKCLLEKGLRTWISNESNSSITELERKLKSEKIKLKASIESFFEPEMALEVISGKEMYLPILDLQDDVFQAFRSTDKLTSIDSLKQKIIVWTDEVWDIGKMTNELILRNKCKEELKLKPFIESGDPRVFSDFFHYLQTNGYVDSDLLNFRNLFSGIPPGKKVIFKDANTLNHIKRFFLDNGFRNSPSYSLKTNFLSHINFFEEKDEAGIKAALHNVSKNNCRYTERPFDAFFEPSF